MTERLEAARKMRQDAARLRRIAQTETKVSDQLVQIAEQMEEEALRLERAFREKPPGPAMMRT